MSEPFSEDFEALVEHLCKVHERHCNERCALFGHSMGALVAYGMAMRWQFLSRRPPATFFAAASPAPRYRDPAYFAGKDSDTALIADLRKQGGTPDEVFENPEMLHIALNTLRADYRICAGYQYRPARPLSMPIHVFAGRQDDISAERILAWQAETSAQCSVRWFDGGHFFIRQHESAVLNSVIGHLSDEMSEAPDASALSA